jgi:cathepsin B
MHTVGVPLTPFKAPLIKLPKLKVMPKYLLWNPKYLVSVGNQQSCGACWAFAAADVLADRAMIQTGAIFDTNLSVEQLLSCFDPKGCDGGSPEDAVEWMVENNIVLKSNQAFPFTSGKGTVSTTCPNKIPGIGVKVKKGSIKSLVTFIKEDKFSTSILKDNITAMKTELVTGGPFYCAMTVYDDFFSFTGNRVYTRSKGSSIVGGHAIEIIGYSDEGQDPRKGFTKAHWICRNSWSQQWPTHSALPGYFAIEMGKNMCGIESRCGLATPEIVGVLPKKKAVSFDDLRFETFEEYANAT